MASFSHNISEIPHRKMTLRILHKTSQKPLVLKIFSWTLISEIKRKIEKEMGIPFELQRLFICNVELNKNNHSLSYYGVEDEADIFISEKSAKENVGIIKQLQILENDNHELNAAIFDIQQAFNLGFLPKLTDNGTSGTYFLQNINRQNIAIYKPFDEEPFTPNNPRGYTGKLFGSGFRQGILSGESAVREVASFLLDGDFFGVPPTTYVEITKNHEKISKGGSLQLYADHDDVCGNFGPKLFDVEEVQKIAILDMRILNCDRNDENILVKCMKSKNTSKFHLIPIDHGLTFPDCLSISAYEIVWMEWPQAKKPFTPICLNYINSIDIHKDVELLTSKLKFRKICIRNFIIAQFVLKKCAQNDFTAFEIGSLLYKEEDDQMSEIQSLVRKTEELRKMLKPQIIKNPCFLKIVNLQKEKGKNINLQQEGWEIIESNNSKNFDTPLKHFRKRAVSDFYEPISEKKKMSPHDEKEKEKNSAMDNASTCDEWIEVKKSKSLSQTKILTKNFSLPNLLINSNDLKQQVAKGKHKTKKMPKRKLSLKKENYYDEIFFYYFESLLDQLIQKKIMEKGKKNNLFRNRFCSTDMINIF